MSFIIELLMIGGPFFTFTLLLILGTIIFLIVQSVTKPDRRIKNKALIASLSLFAVVWGFFAQILGLISAFDSIQAAGSISSEMLAGGLKISFIAPVFGLFIFLIGRLGILYIIYKSPSISNKSQQ